MHLFFDIGYIFMCENLLLDIFVCLNVGRETVVFHRLRRLLLLLLLNSSSSTIIRANTIITINKVNRTGNSSNMRLRHHQARAMIAQGPIACSCHSSLTTGTLQARSCPILICWMWGASVTPRRTTNMHQPNIIFSVTRNLSPKSSTLILISITVQHSPGKKKPTQTQLSKAVKKLDHVCLVPCQYPFTCAFYFLYILWCISSCLIFFPGLLLSHSF